MAYYPQRSNVETTVHVIKSKFGYSVRNKDYTAQVNEVLCKVIVYNICCLIMQMHNLDKKKDTAIPKR